MRIKLEKPRNATEQEQTFIRIMETHKNVDLNGLSIIVFAKELTPNLERELRRYRERYENFKYIGVIPQGVIHKTKSSRGNAQYSLINATHENARKDLLNTEYELVCSAIKKHNRKRILGELQHNGQQALDMNYDELIAYQEQLLEEME